MFRIKESVWEHVRAGESVEEIEQLQQQYAKDGFLLYDYCSWNYLYNNNRALPTLQAEHTVPTFYSTALCEQAYCFPNLSAPHRAIMKKMSVDSARTLYEHFGARDQMFCNRKSLGRALSEYTYYAYGGSSENWGTAFDIPINPDKELLLQIDSLHLAVAYIYKIKHFSLPMVAEMFDIPESQVSWIVRYNKKKLIARLMGNG